MGYPPHLGTPKLIEQLKNLAERQSGIRPKHLFVTCGASGAINAALYALKTTRTNWVVTNKRHFPMYPSIVGLTDMIMISKSRKDELLREWGQIDDKNGNFLSLIDSPSNPEGLIYPFESVDIWDAAYASKTYGGYSSQAPKFKVMCGSLAKALGLAGLRLGWVSTNDDAIANSLSRYVDATYVGLSSVSMSAAEEILDALDLDWFESEAKGYLDDNRYEVQKLLTKFGQDCVPDRGMFAILELGAIEREALERANVKWLPGSAWGENDSWARLNLGVTRETMKSAIKTILK